MAFGLCTLAKPESRETSAYLIKPFIDTETSYITWRNKLHALLASYNPTWQI